jgi:hypothetical protein
MSQEIKENIKNFWGYLEDGVRKGLSKFLPKFITWPISKAVGGLGHELLLVDEIFTKKWTPKRISEEIKGISDGAKVSYRELRLTNLIPEIIKAACSIVGAWGPAT